MSGQSLPPKGVEVLPESAIKEANAAKRERLDRAREAEIARLDKAVAELPASMRARLTEMALEQIREPLPDFMARALSADSPSVKARVRELVKRQEKVRMEAREAS